LKPTGGNIQVGIFKEGIYFGTADISSTKKISSLALCTYPLQRRYLLWHCGHLFFIEDICLGTVDICSSKKISTFELWTSTLHRRYLLDISSSKKISTLALWTSPLQ
jgi:hypothetical protein